MSGDGTPTGIHAAPSDIAATGAGPLRHSRGAREGQVRDPGGLGEERRSAIIPMISPAVISGSVRIADAALIALAGILLFHAYLRESAPALKFIYYPTIFSGAVLALVSFQLAGLYRIPVLQRPLRQGSRLVMAWTGVAAALLVLGFLFKMSDQVSRVWFVGWYFTGLGAMLVMRGVMTGLIRRWMRSGRLERRVVIVGGGEHGRHLIEALKASAEPDIKICGVFDDRRDDRVSSEVAGYPMLGTVDELVRFARSNRIDLLIMALPLSAERRVLEMMRKLWVLPVDIRLSALDVPLRMTSATYSYVGNVPFFNLYDKPLSDWDHVLKTVEDRLLAAIFLTLLSPLLLLIAVAIKLDSKGPVFFKQRRYGFNNELIEVYKFRTLKHEQTDANAARLVTANDDRVTRVGRFLRRSSFDELPQFITALKGDMSIVGPRPHAILAKAGDELYGDVVDGYFARHRVKPGITGWAQINGWRGETDTREKILRRTEHDLYYIENWSLLLDLYIIARTPISMLRGENAF
ncbi:MAG: undecaprenyl-phosphate glucose phosphotransferase [Parvibaculum sedimenti]|uniref:undecaprenyl-phosphate glucose phosphotransferase n=1 Tax=Parvibaculum sedimenti TaxID=2608632 RepID=UPI003BB796AE